MNKKTKKVPWGRVVGALLLLAFLVWLGFKAVNWLDASITRNTEMAVTKAIAEMQVVVVDNDKEIVKNETIGSNPGDDTYFPEFSCSHLESCQISEVPQGFFTIGYKNNGNGCDWKLFNEGETIDYENLDEIHTYNNLLPLTKLEGFVAAQFQYVLACTNN